MTNNPKLSHVRAARAVRAVAHADGGSAVARAARACDVTLRFALETKIRTSGPRLVDQQLMTN